MDLFPSSAVQPQAPAANPAGPGLAERWRGWMSKPENAALLMQSGIAMLQPMQLGQSTAGAIASSVGEGFQARDRVRANAAATAQQGTENTQKQQQIDIANRGETARAKYYESMPGKGGVSASAIFRDKNADDARKTAAWMKFLADVQFQNPDTTPEEIYPQFEEAWNLANAGQIDQTQGAPAASAALPGLDTAAPSAPTSGSTPKAKNAKGEMIQYVGGKWVPM